MNKMPGFTAEKSIDRMSGHYYTVAVFRQATGFLQPAQIEPAFCDHGCMASCCACKHTYGLSGHCKSICGDCPEGCSGYLAAD